MQNHNFSRSILGWSLSAAFLVMISISSSAQLPFGSVYATTNVRPDITFTDRQSGPRGGTASSASSSKYGSASAFASATAGSIGVSAFAQSVFDPGNQEYRTSSSSQVTAEFHDSLLVISTFAPNVPIRIRVTNLVTGALSASSPTRPEASFADVAGGVSANTGNSGVGLSIGGNTIRGSFGYDSTGYLDVFSGDTITLDYHLEAEAITVGDSGDTTPFASSDYAHTLHVYLDPTFGNVTLLSISGFNYATPTGSAVPEPGAIAMLFGATVSGESSCSGNEENNLIPLCAA